MAQQMKGFATKPQLNTQNPHGKGREITLPGCSLTSIHACVHVCTQTQNTYTHQ